MSQRRYPYIHPQEMRMVTVNGKIPDWNNPAYMMSEEETKAYYRRQKLKRGINASIVSNGRVMSRALVPYGAPPPPAPRSYSNVLKRGINAAVVSNGRNLYQNANYIENKKRKVEEPANPIDSLVQGMTNMFTGDEAGPSSSSSEWPIQKKPKVNPYLPFATQISMERAKHYKLTACDIKVRTGKGGTITVKDIEKHLSEFTKPIIRKMEVIKTDLVRNSKLDTANVRQLTRMMEKLELEQSKCK